jgi:CRISPR-associated endoribonuclease Cas6
MVITHFNQYMTTNKGIIEIAANPEILQLLYDVGIGVRRSQGFGMLEII